MDGTHQTGPPPSRRTAVHAALIAAAALATYASTGRNGFLWDDHDIIVRNDANARFASIPALFSSADTTSTGHHAAYYRPLTRLTYVVDRQIFGLDPAGYHLENAVLHAATAVAVHAMVLAILEAPGVALVAGVLTAVHPVHAEAVNFLSTRNTLLSTLFFVLALLAYHRARQRGTRVPVLALLAFLAALLSKETAAMLVAIVPVYDAAGWNDLRAGWRWRALRCVPFAAVLALYLVLRVAALGGAIGAVEGAPGLGPRLLANLYAIPEYARLLVFPRALNAYHLLPPDWTAGWPRLALAWVATGVAVALLLRLRDRAVGFGLLWLGVNLVPVSGLVPIPSAPVAERYLHLPAIGAWIVFGAVGVRAAARLGARRRWWLAGAGAAVALLLAARTVARNADWREPLAFYGAMAEASPHAALAHYSLGLARAQAGDLPGARDAWRRAAEIEPGYLDVSTRLGEASALLGDYPEAERWFERALQLGRGGRQTLYNLGLARERQGRIAEALAAYQACLASPATEHDPAAERAVRRIERLSRSVAGQDDGSPSIGAER